MDAADGWCKCYRCKKNYWVPLYLELRKLAEWSRKLACWQNLMCLCFGLRDVYAKFGIAAIDNCSNRISSRTSAHLALRITRDCSGHFSQRPIWQPNCVSTKSILDLRRLFSSLSSFTLPSINSFFTSSPTADLIRPGKSSLIISLMDFKIFALVLPAKLFIVDSSNSSYFLFFRDTFQRIPELQKKLTQKALYQENI